MLTLRKRPKTYAILAIALVVGAFLVASWLLPGPKPSHKIEGDLVGICVHSLSANEAALVNESGARWIRIDVSDDFGEAVTNAKAYNLSVLGILDSWMFNKATVFTLEEWPITSHITSRNMPIMWMHGRFGMSQQTQTIHCLI